MKRAPTGGISEYLQHMYFKLVLKGRQRIRDASDITSIHK